MNGPPNPSGFYKPNVNRATRRKGVQYTEDYFVIPVSFGNLAAAAAAAQQSVLIQADAAFEWEATSFIALVHGAATTLDDIQVNVGIQITDGGSGRILFFNPAPLSSIAGAGRQLYWLPVSRIFQPKSQILFNAVNNDPATQFDDIQLILHGRKIFEGGPGNFPH